MMKGDEDARLEASAYPLIVFVHVPKTAGSTIKKILDLCTPRGYRDVQYFSWRIEPNIPRYSSQLRLGRRPCAA